MNSVEHAEMLIAAAELTPAQEKAARAIAAGQSACVTGVAGCGKTYVIRMALDILSATRPRARVTRVAPTGVAAVNMGSGATTVHHHFGLARTWWGPGEPRPRKPLVADEIRQTDILIIDEISMVSSAMFTLMDRIYREVRGNEAVFGGAQVVVSGDFMQLPPVAMDTDPVMLRDPAFYSDVWLRLFGNPASVHVLTESKRHADETMCSFLADVRRGQVTPLVIEQLKLMTARVPPPGAVRLFTVNAMAKTYNKKLLDELAMSGADYMVSTAEDYLAPRGSSDDAAEAAAMAPDSLYLVVGAPYMFKSNLQLAGSPAISNGTIGVLEAFTHDPPTVTTVQPGFHRDQPNLVIRVAGQRVIAGIHDFTVERDDAVVAARFQYPVVPAFALTIHSTQGLTLSAGVVDLARAFADGQAYVALSRFRSLDGISTPGEWQTTARAISNRQVGSGEDFYNAITQASAAAS